ncbi:MAG: hypothetical protein ACUVTY_09245 [Armatimonadota bacterium]
MWVFFAYLIAATAFYTILVMIAQPEPYGSEAWEMPEDTELPMYSVQEQDDYESLRKVA